jgi:hypothetical protein
VQFRNKHDLKEVFKVGEVIDITEERFAEILETGAYVERIEEPEKPKKKPAKKKAE